MSTSRPVRILLCVLCGLALRAADAGTNFLVVPPDTPDVNPTFPYTDWSTAATDLVAVVALASVPGAGNTVTVSNGTYGLTGEVAAAHITLVGLHGAANTILQRDPAFPAFRVASMSTGRIEGLTLTGGDATNCAIPNGGGLYLKDAAAVGCVVIGNAATNGGGVFLDNADLVNSLVLNNLAAANPDGGGGGVAFGAQPGRVLNCTIVDNYAIRYGGGVYASVASVANTVSNSILYHNAASGDMSSNAWPNDITYDYCAVAAYVVLAGVSNLTGDPGFVNPTIGDFRLAPGSPCIDSGASQAWMSAATDLQGYPRILGADVDRGALEYAPVYPFLNLTPGATNLTLLRGQATNAVMVISNSDSAAGLIWTAWAEAPWLTLTATSGLLGAAESRSLDWTNSAVGLAVGTYTGTIAVVASNAFPYYTPATGRVTVVMEVQEIAHPDAWLDVQPINVAVSALRNGGGAATVEVANASSNSPLFWSLTATDAWLSVSSTNGRLDPLAGAPLAITAAPNGIVGGVYTGLITVVATNEDPLYYPATAVVACVLTVMDLQRDPDRLDAVLMQGAYADRTVCVWNAGPGILDYTVASDVPWMIVDRAGGSLTGQTADATNTLAVTFTNTAALPPGLHNGTLTITAAAGGTVTVAAELTVKPPPMLAAAPLLLNRVVMEGQEAAAQTVQVSNASADYGIGYTVSTSVPWIEVSSAGGWLDPLATHALTVACHVASFPSGGTVPANYPGAITLTATNPALGSPATLAVNVRVNPKPRLALSPAKLSAAILVGQAAPAQRLDVWNGSGYFTLSYAISNNAPWLLPAPTAGTSTGEHDIVTVQFSSQNLKPGVSNAILTVVGQATDGPHWTSAVQPTQQVQVALTIYTVPVLRTDARPAYAYTVRKGIAPPPTVVHLWNGALSPRAPMRFTVTRSQPWLRIVPATGSITGQQAALRVDCDTAGFMPGSRHRGVVRVAADYAATGAPAFGSPIEFAIEVQVREFKGFDFQGSGSGASDLAVYRDLGGEWALANLLTGFRTNLVFGGLGFLPVPGNYAGDGTTQLGLLHAASGQWYARRVNDDDVLVLAMAALPGAAGAAGDYDGDGRTDPGIYQQSAGLWMVRMSASGYRLVSGILGGPGYTVLPAGDYDGDGKTDPGVYHRASAGWIVVFSASHTIGTGIFGGPGHLAVPADYDGDGITDPAVYERATGRWLVLPSSTLTSQGYGLRIYPFSGLSVTEAMVPAPADYDGDGRSDLALYDTFAGTWYIISTSGIPIQWNYRLGANGFAPVWW